MLLPSHTHTPPFYIFNSLWVDLVQKCEFTSPSHLLSTIFRLCEEAKLHEENPHRHRKNMQTHRKALKIFLQFSINFRNFCTTPCTNLLLLNTINLLTGLKDKLNSIYNQGFKAKINFFLDGFLTYLYMSRQFGGAEGSNPPGVKGLSVCSPHLCSSLGPQPIDIHSGDR